MKNDRKWNTITLAVWFFVFVYFGLSYALAEEPTEEEFDNTVLATSLICAAANAVMGDELLPTEDKVKYLEDSMWWEGFAMGWADWSEERVSAGVWRIRKEMNPVDDDTLEGYVNVLVHCEDMKVGLEELLEEEGD